MASQWPTFTRQKLFLANTLFRLAEEQDQATRREASLQGGVALLSETRSALLSLIADLYQVSPASRNSIDALAEAIDYTCREVEELRALATEPGSWWQHVDGLLAEQGRPVDRKKAEAQDNLIAVSAQSGPDRTPAELLKTTEAIRRYIDGVLERHEEW
ncbi:DUF6586 family protein [Marinobacter bohaiensis]|uniref:DUF6586 family protein n=1 Tax=Marinobacter bohaiensis TaxID=2201898 RepID=UPI000DAEEEBC|nr:DUF6586 family protein [Marinobacter bohaiensis]